MLYFITVPRLDHPAGCESCEPSLLFYLFLFPSGLIIRPRRSNSVLRREYKWWGKMFGLSLFISHYPGNIIPAISAFSKYKLKLFQTIKFQAEQQRRLGLYYNIQSELKIFVVGSTISALWTPEPLHNINCNRK